jgi:hypothetical protein
VSGRVEPGTWRSWGFIGVAAAVAAAAAVLFRADLAFEAWLFGWLLLAGLTMGALALLMIGHLIGGDWLEPVRDELEAASLAAPLVALLAIPLAFGLDRLYPWTGPPLEGVPGPRGAWYEPTFFLIRSAIYLVAWVGLAVWMTRPGEHPLRAAAGLAILLPTATLAAVDWVASRDPNWWSSLFGFAFLATQCLPVLAGAILVSFVRPGRPDDRHLKSLERGLVTLALLILWMWFAQFVVVWLANLPDEAAWYLARFDRWSFAKLGIVVPALALSIALLVPPKLGGFPLYAATALMLAQHVAHMVWLVDPAVRRVEPWWMFVLFGAGLGALWLLWVVAALHGRPNRLADEPEERPMDASGEPEPAR